MEVPSEGCIDGALGECGVGVEEASCGADVDGEAGGWGWGWRRGGGGVGGRGCRGGWVVE